MSDKQKHEGIRKRRASMDAEYNEWRPHLQAIRDNMFPAAGQFDLGEQKSAKRTTIIDNTAIIAHRTLVAGMMSGITSPSRPWFKTSLFDDAALDDPEVKAWLYEVETRMYRVFTGSNIYRMFHNCYSDVSAFGTFVGMVVEDFDQVIKTISLPVGSYRIANDERNEVGHLHYEFKRTVGQLVDEFGKESCSQQVQRQYDDGHLHKKVDVCHVIEPRMKRDIHSKLAREKPIASFYYEKGKESFLAEGGYDINPIIGVPWEKREGHTFGMNCPGMLTLGDAYQLQQKHIDKDTAHQFLYKPVMNVPSTNKFFKNVPGGINPLNPSELARGGARPAFEVRPDTQYLLLDIEEIKGRVRAGWFSDLFLLASQQNLKDVTATAVAEMHEEKLLVLGPLLESLNDSLLTPVIETTFHHMQNAGLIPPAPESIEGQDIKIEFVSLFAQAQKAVGTAPIERTLGFAATVEGIKPGTMDNIDGDEALREFAQRVGPPPAIMKPKDDVEKVRQARAQRAAQQNMIDNAQPLANSAKLISEANARGQEGLEQIGAI